MLCLHLGLRRGYIVWFILACEGDVLYGLSWPAKGIYCMDYLGLQRGYIVWFILACGLDILYGFQSFEISCLYLGPLKEYRVVPLS